MHPRKAIRAGFKARLLNGTAAEDRVYATMTPPVNVESLMQEGPVLMVYVRRETIKPEDYPKSGFDGAVRRTLEIAIEAVAVGAEIDDKIDDLAEEIEALLEDWEIPSHPAATVHLVESQLDVTDAFERITGAIFMVYEVKYFAPYRADTSAGWLPTTVFAEIQAGGPVDLLIEPGEAYGV